MTTYRQQALACAASLAGGPRRARDIRSVVPNASSILLRNVYGWFTRIERGVYPSVRWLTKQIHSPAVMVAACPTTVTTTRWPRAFARKTQKPFLALV
jgi:hypothetical protein